MSLPVNGSGSLGRPESMREILHEKPFPPVQDCPIQVEVSHFPAIATPPKKRSPKKIAKFRSTAEIFLPEVGCADNGTVCETQFRVDRVENLEKFFAAYGSFALANADDNEIANVVGPSSCTVDFEVPVDRAPEILIKSDEVPPEESNALRRWEFWMRDKKKTQEYLGKRLQRNTCELVLQNSDKYRKVLEEKALRTYTQIPEPDKWRGHPFRWKAAFNLPNRNINWKQTDPESSPVYSAAETKLDKGEIPEMEFIGIPATIQKEKGLICEGSVRRGRLESRRSDDIRNFQKIRKKLKPHDIDMEELEVIGKKIVRKIQPPPKPAYMLNLPKISVTEVGDHFHEYQAPPESCFCLAIENDEIKYELKPDGFQVPAKAFAWQVNFNANVIGTVVERELRVENRGSVAIRYSWISEKPRKSFNLEKLQPKKYEPWFFFNKNSGIFLPGQIYNLKFYHQSKTSGIRKEVWYLKTDPPLTENYKLCKVILSAVATDDGRSNVKIRSLRKYMNYRLSRTIVKSMIEVILRKTILSRYDLRGIEYRSIFSEKTLFEKHNPIRFYNSAIVNELKKTFEEVTFGNQKEWDLSLNTLVNQVQTLNDRTEKNDFLYEISEKAQLLLKPTYVSSTENKKYRMAYEILCAMMNYMEEDYDFFRWTLSQKVEEPEVKNVEKGFSEEAEELNYYSAANGPAIKTGNYLFFKAMVYIKVYSRVCEAVERIAGALETVKLFQPWKQTNTKPKKPFRKQEEHLYIARSKRIWVSEHRLK